MLAIRQQEEPDSDTDDSEEYETGCVTVESECRINALNEDEKWTATLIAKQNRIKVKLDTGAECNVLPLKEAERIGAKMKKSQTKRLITYNNEKIEVVGEIKVECKNKKYSEQVIFQVVNENLQPTLGRRSCENMGYIKRIYKIDIDHENLVKKGEKSNIGCCKTFEYDIDFIDNPTFKIIPPRRIPHVIRNEVKRELNNMVANKIIEPVSEPTPAVSPMLVVNKKKLRVCMDPTELNKNIQRRHYPLKTVEEIAAKVKGAKYFTKLDCEKGFWQIRVTEHVRNAMESI